MRRFAFGIVGLAVLVVVVFNVQGWLVLRATSRALERELGDRLQSLATTLSSSSTDGFLEPASRRRLADAVRRDNLFNAFVVNESLQYLVNIRDPDRVGEQDPALELDAAEILSAFSGLNARSRLYSASGYNLATAYAPLPDTSGAISAALGIEADARFFSTLVGFRNSLLLINGLSLIVIVAIVLVSASLTQRALRIEQAAARANTMALMGQMSGAVAHEIKNPLGIIRAAAERLRKQYDPAGGDATFSYITDEVDRLNRVITNYLNLGASAAPSTEQVNLTELIGEVAAAVGPDAAKSGVAVETRFDVLPAIQGNRLELRQVFLNLLLNAIQAQPEGGSIRVTGLTERRGNEQMVIVHIADQGSGIKPQDLSRVFEPFFTTREKGSGLGLFVVRRVIEAHKGSVKITSGPNQGTTVAVEIPGAGGA